MKLSVKILSLLLGMLLCVTPLLGIYAAEDDGEVLDVAAPADGDAAGETSTAVSDEAGKEPEPLPSSVTLVGTEHLPPIMNQGEVGCCASAAITYMQFTNAVSRYLHSINPAIQWNPSSGDGQYIFSPKFTYQYSGAGTEWVYTILKDHGCLTMDKCNFAVDKSGGFKVHISKNRIYPESAAFEVSEGLLKTALQYRITNYEQIWLTKSYLQSGKVAITTTEKGQALVTKIKDALNRGNVVVTGGYPSRWQYSDRLTNLGTLAQSKNEKAIIYSTGDAPGGHQVSIVGYDDDIEVRVSGVTLKGAFLVANSWAESWQNDGYAWMMYDALNEVSEFEKLNVKNRTWTMDQMCFLYWDEDIATVLPDLYIEFEAESLDREGAAIVLLRKSVNEETGKEVEIKYMPMMFSYGPLEKNYHTDFETGKSFTYSGKIVGDKTEAETGYYAISMDGILRTMERSKTFADYEWGVRLYSVNKSPVTYKSVKLVTGDGKVLADMDLGENGFSIQAEKSSKSERKYFSFSPAVPTLPEGEHFTAEQTAGGKYMVAGDSYSFRLMPDEGYTLENATVTLNGTPLTADETGVYTVAAAATNQLVVDGVALISENQPAEEENNENSPLLWIIIGAGVVVVVAVLAVVLGKKKKSSAGD